MEITCPSGLRGIIGKPKVRVMNEMRKLADHDRVKSFTYLLSQCWLRTVAMGPYKWDDDTKIPWEDVVSGDRFFLLLKIREVLYGADYKFNARCSNCKSSYEWIVNINDLPIKKLPAAVQRALTQDDKLCEEALGNGVKFRFRAHTGATERAMMQDDEEPALREIMPRLFSYGDQTQPHLIREALLDLDADVFDELVGIMKEAECGVDTRFNTTCKKCGAFNPVDLPFGQGFFFPRSMGVESRPTPSTSSDETESGTK